MQTRVLAAFALLSVSVVPTYAAGGGPQKICFDYGAVADYKAGGGYDYVVNAYHNSGTWKYLGKGQYQVTFQGGKSRIDTYEEKGGGAVVDHAPSGQFSGHHC